MEFDGFSLISQILREPEKKRALLLVIVFHIIPLILVLESTLRHTKQILMGVIYTPVMAIIGAICHGQGKNTNHIITSVVVPTLIYESSPQKVITFKEVRGKVA